MSLPDLINAAFEACSGVVCLLNVRALWRAKRIQGVHWGPTAFFTAWGLWNLFYYPHLGQWASFVGGMGIVAANAAWLSLVWRFRLR